MSVFLRNFGKNISRHPKLTLTALAFMSLNLALEKSNLKRHAGFLSRAMVDVRAGRKKILCRLTDLPAVSDVFLVDEYSQLRPDKNSVVFDIGANIGAYSVKVSDFAGRIIAVEPSAENFDLLKKNLARNRIKNVRPVNCALSSSDGYVDFFFNESSSAESSMFNHGGSTKNVQVKAVKLDSLVKSLNLGLKNKRIVIKMDVEGAELEVLKGAESLLRSKNVNIMMETHPHIVSASKIEDFLEKRGFEVRRLYFNQPFIFARKL